MTLEEISGRITEYLAVGGLFNPELMEHHKVRDLLIEIRKFADEEIKKQKVDVA